MASSIKFSITLFLLNDMPNTHSIHFAQIHSNIAHFSKRDVAQP